MSSPRPGGRSGLLWVASLCALRLGHAGRVCCGLARRRTGAHVASAVRAQDRTYVASQKKVPVYECGLHIFRDEVCRHVRIKERLLHMLLDMVQRERMGEMIERGLLKTVTSMLVELGRDVYQRDFEAHFLASSATFYQAESQEYISQNSAADYMKKADQRLQEEVERVAHYLDPGTEPKIKEVAERELIAAHMRTIAEMEHSGVVAMIEDGKLEDLRRAYDLFKRVTAPTKGLDVIKDIMAAHVRARGTQLVQDEEINKDPVSYVQGLLALRDKYEAVISNAFASDKQFTNALNQSFEHFVNLNTHSPEYISLFVDEQLRKGMKGISEEEVRRAPAPLSPLARSLALSRARAPASRAPHAPGASARPSTTRQRTPPHAAPRRPTPPHPAPSRPISLHLTPRRPHPAPSHTPGRSRRPSIRSSCSSATCTRRTSSKSTTSSTSPSGSSAGAPSPTTPSAR